eukprot:sb/3474849/
MWLRGYSRLKKVGLENKSVLFLLARTCKVAARHPDYNRARVLVYLLHLRHANMLIIRIHTTHRMCSRIIIKHLKSDLLKLPSPIIFWRPVECGGDNFKKSDFNKLNSLLHKSTDRNRPKQVDNQSELFIQVT